MLFFETESSDYELSSWDHDGSYNKMYLWVIFLKLLQYLKTGRCLINVFPVNVGVADSPV